MLSYRNISICATSRLSDARTFQISTGALKNAQESWKSVDVVIKYQGIQ